MKDIVDYKNDVAIDMYNSSNIVLPNSIKNDIEEYIKFTNFFTNEFSNEGKCHVHAKILWSLLVISDSDKENNFSLYSHLFKKFDN